MSVSRATRSAPRALKIGLDYLPAVAHAPGVGRYVRELTRALVQLPDSLQPLELGLFEVGGARRCMSEASLGLADGRVPVRRVRARVPRRVLDLVHRTTGFAADTWLGGVDVFHAVLPGSPPVARARRTLAVAELPPVASRADSELARALAAADALLVFSAHYAGQLTRRYGIDPARVHQVPVGCDHWRRELRGPHVSPLRREARPTVLVLGAVRPARRQLVVLRALEELASGGRELRLKLVGRRSPASYELERALANSPLRQHVRWNEELDEPTLARAVAEAALVCHLNTDEGTPITPLECLSLGTPVVASRLPALVEALGEHATWVDNALIDERPRTLADAIDTALGTGDDAQRKAQRLELADAWTWERNARATVAVWRGLVG